MSHFLNVTLPLLAKYPKSPLIKWYSGSANAPSWTTVTYHQYLSDLDVASSYWNAQLSAKGIQSNSVVGVWYVFVSLLMLIRELIKVPNLKAYRAEVHRSGASVRRRTRGLHPTAIQCRLLSPRASGDSRSPSRLQREGTHIRSVIRRLV